MIQSYQRRKSIYSLAQKQQRRRPTNSKNGRRHNKSIDTRDNKDARERKVKEAEMLSDCRSGVTIPQSENPATPKSTSADLSQRQPNLNNIQSLRNLVVLQQRKNDTSQICDRRQNIISQSVSKMVDTLLTRSQSNVLNNLNDKKATMTQIKPKLSNSRTREDCLNSANVEKLKKRQASFHKFTNPATNLLLTESPAS